MYADLTRLMVPASLRDAMIEQGRRTLDLQKQVLDWQLAQAEAGRAQASKLFDLGVQGARSSAAALTDLNEKTLAALQPAGSQAAESQAAGSQAA